MNFENLNALLSMGGHGLYVWLSYGVGFFIFAFSLIMPFVKRKAILKEIAQLQRRKEMLRNQEKSTQLPEEL